MIYIWKHVVQLPGCVQLFATPWTAAGQSSLSLTIFQSLPKFMSIELLMPSNHLTLCHPLLLLPSIFPSIRVFSNDSALRIRWRNYRSFSFSISSSEGGNRTGSLLKAGLHLGPDCGLWAICPVSVEMTYQLENQTPPDGRAPGLIPRHSIA